MITLLTLKMMRSAGQSRARGRTIWGHLLWRWTMSRYQLACGLLKGLFIIQPARAGPKGLCALRALGPLMAERQNGTNAEG